MIGKAIHKILKNKISDLSTGAIYPVIMPQNAKYSLGDASSYPAIIYHNSTDYIKTKDKLANMLQANVSIQVVSESYKTTNQIATQVRDVLDHYIDYSKNGLDEVKGFTSNTGYTYSFIENISIANVFYEEEEDEYFEDLLTYSRVMDYKIFYYNNIDKLAYNKGTNTITNPLMLSLDCTQITQNTKGALMSTAIATNVEPSNLGLVRRIFNKTGSYYAKETPTGSRAEYSPYLATESGNRPTYANSTTPAYLKFETGKYLRAYEDAYKNISLSAGALIVFVYKPIGTGGSNYLLGNHIDTSGGDAGNIVLDHKKIGSDITLEFNPKGNFSTFSSATTTLITSTDSANYWDADTHFLALSLGGNKAQTGGSYNQSGWYEYFNSDYNPKLTTGQIIKNNSFTGNSDTYSNSLTFAGWGDSTYATSGLGIHEMLLFVPESIDTHNIDADASPFQPTDIIYNQIKDYIYNKYDNLK